MIDTMPAKAGKQKKSALRDWGESILFAVVVATLFRWLLFEQFIIPTPSMEGTMLVGDVIVVSKLHYGTRTLATPIQFPLTHQKFWGTEIPSYLDWVKLPMYRLPGLRKVKRMEPVVFNYPYEDQHPTDLKSHWVKRCVGLPGDSLKVVEGLLMVNDSVMPLPAHLQSSYFIAGKQPLKDRFFEVNNISEHQEVNGGYYVQTEPATAEKIKQLPFISTVEHVAMNYSFSESAAFPKAAPHGWTTDNFGQVWVPAKGDTIVINDQSLPVYGGVIVRFEGWKNAEITDGKLYINGYETSTYTFQQNYYFMMGDNRHNSEDSRTWGFVPEDHIVGKPVMVLFSSEEGPWYTLPARIRWSRLFNLIKE
jgi:signal peptidase I